MNRPETDLAIALDLELPAREVSEAELVLIEAHLPELIKDILIQPETKE